MTSRRVHKEYLTICFPEVFSASPLETVINKLNFPSLPSKTTSFMSIDFSFRNASLFRRNYEPFWPWEDRPILINSEYPQQMAPYQIQTPSKAQKRNFYFTLRFHVHFTKINLLSPSLQKLAIKSPSLQRNFRFLCPTSSHAEADSIYTIKMLLITEFYRPRNFIPSVNFHFFGQ